MWLSLPQLCKHRHGARILAVGGYFQRSPRASYAFTVNKQHTMTFTMSWSDCNADKCTMCHTSPECSAGNRQTIDTCAVMA